MFELFLILGVVVSIGLMAFMFLIAYSIMNRHNNTRVLYRKNTVVKDMISQSIERLALAETEIYKRSKELEGLTSKLSLSNEELGRLNTMKDKFMSMVVHDIRTPLATIKGFGGLLQDKLSKDAATKLYVTHIINASEQLARLISDLTDLAMIEAGKLRVEKAEFKFTDMVDGITPGINIAANNRGIHFIVSDIEDVAIFGDKFRLSQVLTNLLTNAMKFTPEGGTVELFSKFDGKILAVFVKDTGPGIHPSEAKLIFQKFYQSKFQAQTLSKKGWGLGLAIATEVVRAHGGKIGVDSAGLGKGSTFWYKIPVVER